MNKLEISNTQILLHRRKTMRPPYNGHIHLSIDSNLWGIISLLFNTLIHINIDYKQNLNLGTTIFKLQKELGKILQLPSKKYFSTHRLNTFSQKSETTTSAIVLKNLNSNHQNLKPFWGEGVHHAAIFGKPKNNIKEIWISFLVSCSCSYTLIQSSKLP